MRSPGHCSECGVEYGGALTPMCDCAGLPPRDEHDVPLPAAHPMQRQRRNRIRALRQGNER